MTIHNWVWSISKKESSYITHNVNPCEAFGIGPNPGVIGLNVSALFLWTGGYPDRAYNRAAESIALAQELNHPYSLTYAHFHNGLLNMWLKNYENARDSAEAVLELAEAHGFHIWSAVGSCLLGAALVNTERMIEGLASIEQGLNAYRGLKTPPVFWPCFSIFARAHMAQPQDQRRITSAGRGHSRGVADLSSFQNLTPELLI